METKTLISVLLLAMNTFNIIIAQDTIIQRAINGETYIIEQRGKGKIVKNKNGMFDQLGHERGKSCEYYYLTNQDEFKKLKNGVVKSIFSETRIKELSEDKTSNILIACLCNQNGEIKAINFNLIDTETITLNEISALEKAFLKMKISIDCHSCPDTKYFLFNFAIFFDRL